MQDKGRSEDSGNKDHRDLNPIKAMGIAAILIVLFYFHLRLKLFMLVADVFIVIGLICMKIGE